MDAWVEMLLGWLALPKLGLGALFLIAFLSATLLPLGSEPAVFGLLKLHPDWFWPAIGVATVGNTLGGAVTWWMGRGAERALEASQGAAPKIAHPRALRWLERWGASACLLSWLPIVGDPLCAAAGWLKLPFWPCVGWMALGKGLRYLFITTVALWLWPAG